MTLKDASDFVQVLKKEKQILHGKKCSITLALMLSFYKHYLNINNTIYGMPFTTREHLGAQYGTALEAPWFSRSLRSEQTECLIALLI